MIFVNTIQTLCINDAYILLLSRRGFPIGKGVSLHTFIDILQTVG